MFKVFATEAVVSKGYENAPAVKFGEKGDSARFRVGWKVYDPRAENKSRWVNISVKAFGPLCERIRKMKLKECSRISLIGRLDEDSWTDERTGEVKNSKVIILEDIEYVSGGGKNQNGEHTGDEVGTPAQETRPEASGNFTGYEPYGNGSSFFDS